MINRLKARLVVYRPAINLAFMISLLILLGLTCGFLLGRMDVSQRIRDLDDAHSTEISRIQMSNQQVIIYLTTRVQELIERQGELANEVSQSARAARSAASSAKASSARAAKSTIRIREIPAAEQENPIEDKHQFPERIEH